MATMDFPASPTIADIHTHGGKRWQWDGAVWRAYSLAFTGTPVAPTAAVGTSTTQIATTAYVQAEFTDQLAEIPGVGNALTFEGATVDSSETTLTVVDPTADRTITLQNADGTVAFVNSEAFTGTPTAPTAAADTNTTQIATTAYVQTELGALSSDSIKDADNDTKVQVEESSDEDIIRFDAGGTEAMTISATAVSIFGKAVTGPDDMNTVLAGQVF